jgi:conjugative transfer region protein TrbK
VNSLGRAIAYVVLAAAIFAAAITLNAEKYPAEDASKPEPSAGASDLDVELARCKAISLEATDVRCKAVWEANRERFFRSGKPYPDRLTDTVPAAAPIDSAGPRK